ncbi:MAG: hypothetical protein ACOCX0_01345 [Bacteroidota bacterium]
MKKTLLLLLLTITGYSFSQADTTSVITIKPYGYVSYEVIYDTYRSLDTRDGELYLFPKRPVFDSNGNDINKRPKLNMLSVHSRFGFDIKGPELFGAKTSGRIEADFFGTQQDFVRLLRLRVALITLKWERSELLMGNTFHPMFVLDCSPSTISFAAAAPFHPLNRSPQVRFMQNLTDDLSASVSFLIHGYHSSAGPNDQQRNSGLPDSQLQVRYNTRNFLIGATAGYKFLSPRDITGGGIATSKNVGSFNLQAFTKVTTQPLTLKLEAVYGENMSNYIMIGGYGAKGIDTAEHPFDWNADYDYANLRTLSLWADIHTNNLALEWGLFAGYTENLGSADPFLSIAGLQRYTDLHNLLRVSPRVSYTAKNLSFGLEYSYYSAVYALGYDQYGKPNDSMDPAVNNHIVVMARYNFQ